MRYRNAFWGFFFLMAAVLVITGQTTAFAQIGVLSILVTVLLVAFVIRSIFSVNFFGIFIPVAVLYMIYQEPFNLMPISSWTLILAAVFASMGFSFIFHRHHVGHMRCHGGFEHTAENMDDNNPYISVNFGASSRYIHADCLKNGQFITSFGALEVFFDQARLAPEGAEISLDCSFGSIKLYVPKNWLVIDNLHTSIGGVDNDTRASRATETSPRLTLNGTVQMGGVEIRYI